MFICYRLIFIIFQLQMLFEFNSLKFCDIFFLAPLAKGVRANVMCPSCLRASILLFVHLFLHACVRKLFLQKTSLQKLLTGFLPNFIGMFQRWSSFKFLQIIVFHEEFWLPWQQKLKKKRNFKSLLLPNH